MSMLPISKAHRAELDRRKFYDTGPRVGTIKTLRICYV